MNITTRKQSLLQLIIVFVFVWVSSITALAVAPKIVSKSKEKNSIDKARTKLQSFAARSERTLLIVDGNNVRGIDQCKWSPAEWMEKIELLCLVYQIDHHVVVWDHGPTPIIVAPSPNALCLFAGLSQRADDVLVHEAQHLRDAFCRDTKVEDTSSSDHMTGQETNYHNLCFITNDGGLQGRLRQLGSDSRVRVLNTNGPVVLDASRFISLVQDVDMVESRSTTNNMSTAASRAASFVHQSVEQAQGRLYSFTAQQKLKYNPTRELTWQRCVLSDAMVRGYAHLMNNDDEDFSSSRSHAYQERAQERGFLALTQATTKVQNDTAVLGSMRLDKKQKQLLAKYNKMWS